MVYTSAPTCLATLAATEAAYLLLVSAPSVTNIITRRLALLFQLELRDVHIWQSFAIRAGEAQVDCYLRPRVGVRLVERQRVPTLRRHHPLQRQAEVSPQDSSHQQDPY